jgi:5-dehydro-2-deoxygluconokinase
LEELMNDIATAHRLDVITMGRSSVDLYCQQIGTRLEDAASFAKSVGGCPTNIAVGTARLGLRSAVLTKVGNEQMGRFIREQLVREGVCIDGVAVDPSRLTALAILSVESDTSFPLLFYRENCADIALCEDDVDADFIASARALVVTGTHFSKPAPDAAQRKAMRLMKAAGGCVVLDIDYRPNLWGLAGHADGDNRYIASEIVSRKMQSVLADCDLIVGTEEEVLIASGERTLVTALKTIRARTAATIVLKRGPMGCIVYDGPIPDNLEDGTIGKGFPIEVYNVLGAGDAFMSGFLRGWLGGEDTQTCATWANACGAFAVSRLLCAPEIPTFAELQFFLKNGSRHHALRHDEAINHVHWATTRRATQPALIAFAIDHRVQLEQMAVQAGAPVERIAEFKVLAVKAAARVAAGRPGFGMLLDEKHGRKAMYEFAKHPFQWLGRPVEQPGSRPLRFEYSQDIGSLLVEWPLTHCAKALCFYHPDDPGALKSQQQQKLRTLFEASRRVGRELMVEVIAGQHGTLDETTLARALGELYTLGIKPDWWKLEPQESPAAWRAIEAVVQTHDPFCRGIVMLGLDAPADRLEAAFQASSGIPMIKGFAVGRTLFAPAAQAWLSGPMSDDDAISDMADRFGQLIVAWQLARA